MLTPLVNGDPRRIGPFTIQNRIGAGGMGTVYLGFNAEGRAAAVKVPDARFADDPEFRARFRREVTAARRVHGRAVAAVVDADPDAASPWLATEYVEGTSLADAVLRHGCMEERLLHGFSVGLADALIAIHAVGVVHRDLKPSNILLAWDGPKVIDFGIARATGTPSHTRTGILIGTLAWMAPEQLRGERAGPSADVFAWGACVTYAATGRPPFASEESDVLNRSREEPPPDLAGVPDALVGLVRAALARHPQERPSAADLVRLLVADPKVRTPADADRAAALALTPWQARPPLSASGDPASALDPDRPDQPTHPLVLRPTPPPVDDPSITTVPVPRRPGQTDPRHDGATALVAADPRPAAGDPRPMAGDPRPMAGEPRLKAGNARATGGRGSVQGSTPAPHHGVRSRQGVGPAAGRLDALFGWLPMPWRRAAPLASAALLILVLVSVVLVLAAGGGSGPRVGPTQPPAQGDQMPDPGGLSGPGHTDPRGPGRTRGGPPSPTRSRPSPSDGTSPQPSATNDPAETTAPSPRVSTSPSPSRLPPPSAGASPTVEASPSAETTAGASPTTCPTANPNGPGGGTPPAC
ncbi:eukaryotic-like serine/threonine-protein kinase [Frankia sp. AiPs1]|uniref:serine/threonine-protein kinase n=1 Tax=Frankia sp. AiPa1 TaxID=573492 RepID=UPI00202B9C1E|nr:serine/threonine-protein kinase [Frankia sp. AiPa1]MCL9759182.1 protein kinase [Frankia sp. AiPa1]